jgi:hypothetical protein
MAATRRVYTPDDANALVPQVRAVLLQLAFEQRRLDAAHAALHHDPGGTVDAPAPTDPGGYEAIMSEARGGIGSLLGLLEDLGIQVRDLEMGLVDFPAKRDGRSVWLCWRLADARVAYWHGTDEGFASRKPW